MLRVATVALFALVCAYATDPRQVGEQMMDAMGGVARWNKTHFVRYDFVVSAGGKQVVDRAHLWDKMTGRYRIESKTKQGQSVVLFNVGTRQGVAYLDGKKLEGAAGTKAVEDAYGAFINDMYWLAMPWKWMDAGVSLRSLGQESLKGTAYDVVELTFGKVGLTPGDRYKAFVSPKSHLMEHWEYILQSGTKGSWDWEYTTSGGVKLAKNHTAADGKSISMGDVKITDFLSDEGVFTDPGKSIR